MLLLGLNYDFLGSKVVKITKDGITLSDKRFFYLKEVEAILIK